MRFGSIITVKRGSWNGNVPNPYKIGRWRIVDVKFIGYGGNHDIRIKLIYDDPYTDIKNKTGDTILISKSAIMIVPIAGIIKNKKGK